MMSRKPARAAEARIIRRTPYDLPRGGFGDDPYVVVRPINASSDLLVVLLDGINFNNCTVDRDCPGRSACLRGATWSAFPSQCACVVTEHLWGFECRERWTAPLGQFLLATWIVLLVLYSGVILACVATLAASRTNSAATADSGRSWWWCDTGGSNTSQQQRKTGGRMRWFVTLDATIFFALVAGTLGWIRYVVLLAPLDFQYSSSGILSLRSPEVSAALSGMSLPYSFFIILAAMNVSVLWLRLAASVMAPNSRVRRFVARFETVRVGIIVVLFALTFYFYLSSSNPRVTRVVALAFVIFVVSLILLSYWLGSLFLRRYVSHAIFVSQSEELREHFALIWRTAITMSLLCGTLMALLIVYVVDFADVPPTPLQDPALVISQAFNVVTVLLLGVIAAYGLASIRLKKKWRERRSRSVANVTGMYVTTFATGGGGSTQSPRRPQNDEGGANSNVRTSKMMISSEVSGEEEVPRGESVEEVEEGEQEDAFSDEQPFSTAGRRGSRDSRGSFGGRPVSGVEELGGSPSSASSRGGKAHPTPTGGGTRRLTGLNTSSLPSSASSSFSVTLLDEEGKRVRRLSSGIGFTYGSGEVVLI